MFQTLIAPDKGIQETSILASLFMTLEVMFEISIPFVMANLLDKGVRHNLTCLTFGSMVASCWSAPSCRFSVVCSRHTMQPLPLVWFAKNLPWLIVSTTSNLVWLAYDGIDVKLIEKDSLRRSLGIVLQDTHLFTGTIAENIAYGRMDATLWEILEAARIANVDSLCNIWTMVTTLGRAVGVNYDHNPAAGLFWRPYCHAHAAVYGAGYSAGKRPESALCFGRNNEHAGRQHWPCNGGTLYRAYRHVAADSPCR